MKVPTTILFSMILIAGFSHAAELDEAESMLDKFEKHLLDQEARQLTFGEKVTPPPPMPETKPSRQMFYSKGTKVQGQSPQMRNLNNLSELIAKLEQNVDQLTADIQKTKQRVLDESKVDNFITLEAHLNESDNAALKNMTVKVDGYQVYSIHDAAGLWLPSKKVPLYAGPLQPGNHRIDIEARLSLKKSKGLPFNDDIYRFVNKTFEISVPVGSTHSTYVIDIKPPSTLEQGATATMTNANEKGTKQ